MVRIYYIGIHIVIVKISIKDIQQSSSPLELFRSGCKSEATFEHYTIYLKKLVFEFLEDVLKSNGYEARVNELVARAKNEPEWIKQIINGIFLNKKKEIFPVKYKQIKIDYDLHGTLLKENQMPLSSIWILLEEMENFVKTELK